MEPNHFKI